MERKAICEILLCAKGMIDMKKTKIWGASKKSRRGGKRTTLTRAEEKNRRLAKEHEQLRLQKVALKKLIDQQIKVAEQAAQEHIHDESCHHEEETKEGQETSQEEVEAKAVEDDLLSETY